MRFGRLGIALVVAVGLMWGMRTSRPPRPLYDLRPPVPVRDDLGSAYDAKACGTVVGRVIWDSPLPSVPPLELPTSNLLPSRTKSLPNPDAPRVRNARVADAIIWLRGVEPTRSRKWDHEEVSVEATELEFVTRQGNQRVRTGFVRRGEAVQFSSAVPDRHSIRGRGAAFFADLLFNANRPTARRLPDEGFVELTSATGAYWCRAHLAVSDTPYLARTNERGEYQLTDVPAGTYDLVAWLPDCHVQTLERDPELVVHVRAVFGPDLEKRESVHVTAGGTAEVEFQVGAGDFK